MTAGRPRKSEDKVCTVCGKLCFFYTNSIKKSPTDVYYYQRSRHKDRTLKDHNIDRKLKKPLRYATEYINLNEVRTYSFVDYKDDQLFYPLKHCVRNRTIPIVVYDFMSIPKELILEFQKLQSSQLTISQKEVEWLLNLKQVKRQAEIKEFYEKILNDERPKRLVTFGEGAPNESDRIRKLGCFKGEIMYCSDQYGMLAEVLKMREKKQKLSKSCDESYNCPPDILTLSEI